MLPHTTMDWINYERAVSYVVGISALVGGLVVIWKNGRKFFKASWVLLKPAVMVQRRVTELELQMTELTKSLNSLTETIHNNAAILVKLMAEVESNGAGMSLRKQLIRESEARWREYEISGKAIWETGRMKNGEFGCVRCTDALTRLVGTSPIGSRWLTSVHPDDQEEIEEAWDESIAYGSVYDKLQRFVHRNSKGKTDKIVYVRAFFKPEFDEDGNFSGGMGQCFELSEYEYLERLKN